MLFGRLGRLEKITSLHGISQTLTYEFPSGNKLKTVTHSSGRQLQFTWTNTSSFGTYVTGVTTPEGKAINYLLALPPIYKGANFEVTYPEGRGKYNYETLNVYQNKIQGQMLIDGKLYKKYQFEYPNGGKVLSSELAGGYNLSTFVYGTDSTGIAGTWVTNAKGSVKKYSYQGANLVAIDRQQSNACPSAASKYDYQPGTNFLNWKEDWKGNRTSYTYHPSGLIKTEYKNKKTHEYVWGENGTLIDEKTWDGATAEVTCKQGDPCPAAPSTPTYTRHYDYYDAAGKFRVKTLTETDQQGNQSRTSYSYTFHPNNFISTKTIDGPRTDVSDITVITYNNRGDLIGVDTANGTHTSFDYQPNSDRVWRMTDPNGLVTEYSYDAKNRQTGVVVKDAQPLNYSFGYTALDQLGAASTPLTWFSRSFDAAFHITREYRANSQTPMPNQSADPVGEYRAFEYDLLSNVTTIKDYVQFRITGTPNSPFISDSLTYQFANNTYDQEGN